MIRTSRDRAVPASPATNAISVATRMPTMVSSTVGSSPVASTDRKCPKLSNMRGGLRSGGRAELGRGEGRARDVALGEPERRGDLEPLAAVVQRLELRVELVHQVAFVLAEDESAGFALFLAVDGRLETRGDLDRGARVLLHQR